MQQFRRSYTAGAAVDRHALVKIDSGKLIATAAKADATFAINTEDSVTADGELIAVQFGGITKAIASTSIALGALLMAAANGRVVTHDASAGTPIVGQAIEAATTAGQLIHIHLYDDKRPYPA